MMVTEQKLTFNKFYVVEFINEVLAQVPKRISGPNADSVKELFNHLYRLEDVTDGIEVIAREHGSGELSIFLFDIVDRIEDYPPTVVYDALMDIVDDFVSGLDLMLEEEETAEAIKNVNKHFRELFEENEIELPEPDELEEIVEPEDEIPESTKEEMIESGAPAPPEAEINFEQYIESEIETQISDVFEKTFKKEAKKFIAYHQLLVDNLDQIGSFKDVPFITQLLEALAGVLPWKCGLDYNASEIKAQQTERLNQYTSEIEKYSDEFGQVISDSVSENKLLVPEVEVQPETESELPELEPQVQEKSDFVKEEIPDEPMTIDALLDQYFQSEVDEHIDQLNGLISKLTSEPANTGIIKEIISGYQSFNEISMIHGYVLIESHCNRMINLFSYAAKEKMEADTELFSIFSDINKLLGKTGNLKDQKNESDESLKLDQLTGELEQNLFHKKSTGKKKSSQQKTKAKEKKSEPEIKYSDQKELAGIMASILDPAKPTLVDILIGKTKDTKVLNLLDQLASSAQLVGLKGLSETFKIMVSAAEKGPYENEKDISSFVNSFVQDLSPQTNPDNWQQKIDSLKSSDLSLSLNDAEKLLTILAEIEDPGFQKFSDVLKKVFDDGDIETRKRCQGEFLRLHSNLLLLNRKDLAALPEYYAGLFAEDNLISVDKAKQDELKQSLKLFLQSLRSAGKGVSAEELVSVLREILESDQGEETPAQSETEELVPLEDEEFATEPEEEEAGVADEEEDLEEIFRQEASSALNLIRDALTALQKDLSEKKQYGTIERNIHTLKSSARLLGIDPVADLCGPIEDVCEKLASGALKPDKAKLDLIGEAVRVLEQVIDDTSTDVSGMIEKLHEMSLSSESGAALEKPGETEKPAGEKPLFSKDSDEDDDLLDIFKEESAEFIHLLEEAINTLRQEPTNTDAIKKLEHASHSLKSPAKMLGFREIGEVGDALENIAEAVKKGELVLNKTSVEKVAGGVAAVKELSAGKKAGQDEMAEIFETLSVNNLMSVEDDLPEDDTAKPGEEVSATDLNVFLGEAADLLEKINHDMLLLEKNPDDSLLIASISRYLHTLKGSAQIMGHEKIGSVAHGIEDLFAYIKDEKIPVPEDSFDVIFKSLDGIQQLTDALKAGKDDPDDIYTELKDILAEGLKALKSKAVAEQKPVIRAVKIDKSAEAPKDTEQTIKITTERLDKFVNMAAELVINKTQLADQLEKLRDIANGISQDRDKLNKTGKAIETAWGKASENRSDEEFDKTHSSLDEILSNLDDLSLKVTQITQKVDENINQISHLTKSLHDDILQVRMVATTLLFSRFPRAVRDMAKKQKKKVNLLFEGEDTEMDRAMIESLTDPVMHLIRNAIDHGIELPKARKDAGKNDDGIILLKARRDKNQVIIEVQDDGRGVDADEIKKVIVDKKLVTAKEAEKLNTEEILDFIFHPGFTTKKSASSTSGRGVGLDAVAETIQNLKGDIRVSSTPGKGTIFSIRLPLTLAITQALIAEVNRETIAIPLNAVEETQDLVQKKIVVNDNKQYLKIRSREIPLINLSDLMHFEQVGEKGDTGNILVIQDGATRYGLVVDRAIRREEIVVRSLGEELKDLDYVAGGTIFGDGSVVLILDIPAITRKVESDYFDGKQDFSSLETARKIIKGDEEKPADAAKKETQKGKTRITRKKIDDRKPSALIIDDSLSVRKFVSSVLERNNYLTALAEDGPEALEELKGNEFDIIITDLEMPKMQGFELIEKIREQDRLKDVPIVILTGKAAKENEAKGIELGANAYIVKPFKENDLLKTLEQFISS